MKRTTMPTVISDKNGKITTVHKALDTHRQSRIINSCPPVIGTDSGIERLEQYLTEWGQQNNGDPDMFDNQKSEYVDTARALTQQFGSPILGGTRAVWDMGTHVAKLAFNDMGDRANTRESQALLFEPDIPVADCYITSSFDAPVLIMEKISEIQWGETRLNKQQLQEGNYLWLSEVESKQAGVTLDGRVVAYDLSESWDY